MGVIELLIIGFALFLAAAGLALLAVKRLHRAYTTRPRP